MTTDKPIDIDAVFAEGKPIEDALRRAVRKAMIRHKQLGAPAVEWRDGKVVYVPADQIPIGDDPSQ